MGIYILGENVTQPDNTHRRSFSAQYIPVSPFSGGKIWLCPSLSLFPGEIARPGKMQGLSKILVVPVITAINTVRYRHSTFQDIITRYHMAITHVTRGLICMLSLWLTGTNWWRKQYKFQLCYDANVAALVWQLTELNLNNLAHGMAYLCEKMRNARRLYIMWHFLKISVIVAMLFSNNILLSREYEADLSIISTRKHYEGSGEMYTCNNTTFDKYTTEKPVYNDRLMGYFSDFWSISRWPRAT